MDSNQALESVLDFIAQAEGGEADDPRDPGGRTRYGISSRAHPGVDLEALTPAAARAIMAATYWRRPGLGRLPPAVAMAVMDTAVQTGPDHAVRFLQRGCNALAGEPRLAVDGALGDRTAGAVNGWCAGGADRARLLAGDLLLRRDEYFAHLAARSGQAAFLRGRLLRTARLWRLVIGGPGRNGPV